MSTELADNIDSSDSIKTAFNGPLIAGVGALADPGLSATNYHVLPWSIQEKNLVRIKETGSGIEYETTANAQWSGITAKRALQWAKFNVDAVWNYEDWSSKHAELTEELRRNLRRDLVTILYVMIAYNYHGTESTLASTEQVTAARLIPTADHEDYLNPTTLNRAATFIAARCHTKYQTNHAIGGSQGSASMGAAIRAFYEIPATASASQNARRTAIASAIYWAVHPVNEALLIPTVLRGTKMFQARVPSGGPKPTTLMMDEFFQLRATTPPAGTHFYYVCVASVRLLRPMGILELLPEPARLADVNIGWLLISTHGAALHPAARYWGLDKQSCNQRLVESLCADLGYAVRKLFPVSTLAQSPILRNENGINSGWKTFIDALRQAMDKAGETMVDETVLAEIKKRIAPTVTADARARIEDVARLLDPAPAPAADEGDEPVDALDL